MSVTIRLADDLDIARGDLICRPHNAPTPAQNIDAMICWMDETRPLHPGAKYTIKHTTRTARALIKHLHYRLDINTLHRDETATTLSLNDIGRIRLRTTIPLLSRPIPPQPHHRRLHPHRRNHQPHRRRRHDHRHPLAVSSGPFFRRTKRRLRCDV